MKTYRANVVTTTGTWITVTVEADTYRTVKAQARKIAKADGADVKFVNDFHLVTV